MLRSEQEAVIRQYQSFLRFVVRRTGADISCLTPGEICELSMKAGVPKKEALMITRTFEKAYYTGARVTVDDVRSMGRGTDKVLGGGR
jgi:hypothetical protein